MTVAALDGDSMEQVKKLTPTRLQQLLGADAAARLMQAFGGRRIPKRSTFHVEHRELHARIRAFAKAHGYGRAAAEFGITERHVRRIADRR